MGSFSEPGEHEVHEAMGLGADTIGEDRVEVVAALHDRRLDRRDLLTAGGLGAAAFGAAMLGRPDPALALTTDVIHDQGGGVFNVKAYGAVGNGTVNDKTAIQNTINAAQSAGGGVVYVPQGDYLIDGTLTISADGIALVGADRYASNIIATFASGDMIHVNNVNGSKIASLNLGASSTRSGGAGIHISGNGPSDVFAAQSYVQDVSMDRQYIGVHITNASWLNYVDRGNYTRFAAGGYGIVIDDVGGGSQFISNIFMAGPPHPAPQPKAAVFVQHTGDFSMHCVSTVQTENGLLIDPAPNKTVAAAFLTNCLFDTPGVGNGITIDTSGGGQAVQLNFVNCWTNQSMVNNGIYIGGNVDRVNIIGHRAYANNTNGIWVNAGGAQNVFIEASECSGNSRGGGAHAGFRLGSTGTTMNDVGVRNCRATASGSISTGGVPRQNYGVIVASGTNNYHVTGNNLRGNLTTNLSDSGGPNKVVANNLI